VVKSSVSSSHVLSGEVITLFFAISLHLNDSFMPPMYVLTTAQNISISIVIASKFQIIIRDYPIVQGVCGCSSDGQGASLSCG
jgi:hypothetical protein